MRAIMALLLLLGCGTAFLSLYPKSAYAETTMDSRISEARQTAELFCKAEFEGDEFKQRSKLVKFSASREKKEKERSGWASPHVVYWDWDAYYIVSNYRVVNVEVLNDKAVATVEYARLGESKGKELIIPSRVGQDIIKLMLLYDANQWWILDPPLPRISKNRIINIYEHNLLRYDDKWRAGASAAQLESFARAQKALQVLKGL